VEKRLPWGIFWLVAGGLALSKGLTDGGVPDVLASQLELLDIPVNGFLFILMFSCTMLSQVASNTGES
jgi:di/tricarboxylate transporter